jgi:hypothetical protein
MNEAYKIGAIIFMISLFILLFGGLGIAYFFAYLKVRKKEKQDKSGNKFRDNP